MGRHRPRRQPSSPTSSSTTPAAFPSSRCSAAERQSDVAAAIASPPVGVNLSQDVRPPGNYDSATPPANTAAVPISMTTPVNGTKYTLTTFIDQCYFTAQTNPDCKSRPHKLRLGVSHHRRRDVLARRRPLVCEQQALLLRGEHLARRGKRRRASTSSSTSPDAPPRSRPSPRSARIRCPRIRRPTITLTGTNFDTGATVSLDTGGTVSNVNVISSSHADVQSHD